MSVAEYPNDVRILVYPLLDSKIIFCLCHTCSTLQKSCIITALIKKKYRTIPCSFYKIFCLKYFSIEGYIKIFFTYYVLQRKLNNQDLSNVPQLHLLEKL